MDSRNTESQPLTPIQEAEKKYQQDKREKEKEIVEEFNRLGPKGHEVGLELGCILYPQDRNFYVEIYKKETAIKILEDPNSPRHCKLQAELYAIELKWLTLRQTLSPTREEGRAKVPSLKRF